MAPVIEIIGVYPVKAPEPCHLIELWVRNSQTGIDVGMFTQPMRSQPRSNWQAAYDEKMLDSSGVKIVADDLFGTRPESRLWAGDLRIA
ncbi:MAG TPA: hypothetical protein VGY55_01935, partial [Pirellulales bacterium]|nr:hypothetical protein [Pirellulales bacterium]